MLLLDVRLMLRKYIRATNVSIKQYEIPYSYFFKNKKVLFQAFVCLNNLLLMQGLKNNLPRELML